MRLALALILISSILFSFGQGTTSHWCFGDSASIQFQNFSPNSLGNSIMKSEKGTATISSATGVLEYYSRPDTVYSSQHNVVVNGSGIRGDEMATQAALIMPHPVNPDWHFLVTNKVFDSNPDSNGLYLSQIRKTIDSPTGKFIESMKNVLLFNNVSESFTSTHHANGKDVWITTRIPYSDTLVSILIGEFGAVGSPVYSVTSVPCQYASSGQLKSSPSGEYLSEVFWVSSVFDPVAAIHKFDRTTGLVSESVGIAPYPSSWTYTTYGTEFSQDSKRVYLSYFSQLPFSTIQQYSIQVFDSTTISDSRVQIGDSIYGVFSMQIGIDSRIYTATRKNFLGCIYNPSDSGLAANYVDSALHLTHGVSNQGLPDFIQTSFHPAYFDYVRNCSHRSTRFYHRNPAIDSVFWNFGDTATGALNFSSEVNPEHQFSSAGTFGVTSIIHHDSIIDTFYREIVIIDRPSFGSMPLEYHRCIGDTVEIVVPISDRYTEFGWSDNSSDSIRIFNESTSLVLTLANFCDTIRDTFELYFDPSFQFDLTADTVICDDSAFTIDPKIDEDVIYEWSTGAATPNITIHTNGVYSLKAFNSCDTLTDSIKVTFRKTLAPLLLTDTVICDPPPYSISSVFDTAVSYFIISEYGDSLSNTSIYDNGRYTIIRKNECGFIQEDFVVEFSDKPTLEIVELQTICENGEAILEAFTNSDAVLWSTGDTSEVIKVSKTGSYRVETTESNCLVIDSFFVDDVRCDSACRPRISNVITPNADGVNDLFFAEINCVVSDFQLEIYNRWGQLIFQSTYQRDRFDGYVNGTKVSEGVYYYSLSYLAKGRSTVSRGAFTILH